MRLADTLTAAKAIIADRRNWTQGAFARNIEGSGCEIYSPNAACFCLDAALAKASGVTFGKYGAWFNIDHYTRVSTHLSEVCSTLTGEGSFVGVNDGEITIANLPAHNATLMLLDVAIARAKALESVS